MKNRNALYARQERNRHPGSGALRAQKQFDWTGLTKGTDITVATSAGERYAGTVDHVTPDGIVVWLHLERGMGHKLFIFTDVSETTVTAHGSFQAARELPDNAPALT